MGSLDTYPFYFSLNHFTLYYSGRSIPSEGLPLDMSHEKISVLAYNLFNVPGLRYSNAELQITPHVYSGVFHPAVRSHPTAPPQRVIFRSPTRAI
jgi:hypothetical protein